MAIRYSGDAEVRVRWHPVRHAYVGTVRDPDYRWRGVAYGDAPKDSRDYDRAARDLLEAADEDSRSERRRPLRLERDGRELRVRRVFQSPCPVRIR
jgi:hypothetical protein